MAAGRRRGLDQDGIALPESADVVDAQADGRRHLQAIRRGGLARQFPAVRVRDADPVRVPDLGDVVRGGRMRRRRNERGQQACQHGRRLLGVPEAEALTGVPAKIIRAQVRNGLLKARMAGSTTMRIRRADLDAWLDALPAWHA